MLLGINPAMLLGSATAGVLGDFEGEKGSGAELVD